MSNDFKIYWNTSIKFLFFKTYKWFLAHNQQVRNGVFFVTDGARHWPSISNLFFKNTKVKGSQWPDYWYFFCFFYMKLGLNEHIKVTQPSIWEKFLSRPDLSKWEHLCAKNYVFLKLCPMASFYVWVKVTVLDFKGKFIFWSKWGVLFKALKFPLNLFIWFFRN